MSGRYNPNHVAPIAAILQSGVVVRHQFQPYEVHIPYLLQFMIDFNVVGMGLVNMRSVMFRLPVPLVFQKKELNNHIHIEYNEMQERLYLKSTVNLDLCLPGKVERMSYSDIEMDGICEGKVYCYSMVNSQASPWNRYIELQSNR